MILVVRVEDSRGARKVGHVMTDPGDIIEVVGDDHQFTSRELNNPDYRFVKVDILPVEAEALRVPDVDPVTRKAKRMRKHGIPINFANRFKVGEIGEVTRAAFLAAVRLKDQ